MGRPEIPAPPDFAQIVRKWEKGQLTMQEAARLCNMSESTFYRRLREVKAAKKG